MPGLTRDRFLPGPDTCTLNPDGRALPPAPEPLRRRPEHRTT
ncbi:hypothetical protein ACFV30_18980 [Streptomyces sp. NPDC059752]